MPMECNMSTQDMVVNKYIVSFAQMNDLDRFHLYRFLKPKTKYWYMYIYFQFTQGQV